MLWVAVIGLMGGAALGLFCRVFVLVPAHAALLAAAALVVFGGAMPAGRAMLWFMLASTGCDIGYLAAALCAAALHHRALPLRRVPH